MYIKGLVPGLRQLLTIEKTFMKNAFYFMLKVLLVFEIFAFLSWLFGYVEKRLDKKAMANFKIYHVTDYTKITRMEILLNILKRIGNHAVKFGQLIIYNLINIFL